MKTKTQKYMDEEKKYLFPTTVDDKGPVIVGGAGSSFQDIEGNLFTDATSQISLNNTGLCHKKVRYYLKAMTDALTSVISADWPYSVRIRKKEDKRSWATISRVELAKKLIKLTDRIMPFEKLVMFEASGSLAVNVSAKIQRISYLRSRGLCSTEELEKLRKQKILSIKHNDMFNFSFFAFRKAFHGRHGEAQMLSNSKAVHLWGASSSCSVARLTLPTGNITKKQIKDEVDYFLNLRHHPPFIGFFFEPIQGEGGINVPDKDGLVYLVNYLREKGIYIIADEIQTGLGRTGKMFGCEHFGIEPDMILLSKSLGAGLPISAVVANKEKFNYLEPGMHSGSMHASPIPAAAVHANLEVIEEAVDETKNAQKMGEYALVLLRKIVAKHPDTVWAIRGKGLMIGMEFFDTSVRNAVINLAKKQKNLSLLLAPCGKKVIRFCPPIIISAKKLKEQIQIFENVLNEIDK